MTLRVLIFLSIAIAAQSLQEHNADVQCTPGAKLEHPADCSKYYVCDVNNIPNMFQCSEGYLFNPETSRCDYPENVSCFIPTTDDEEETRSTSDGLINADSDVIAHNEGGEKEHYKEDDVFNDSSSSIGGSDVDSDESELGSTKSYIKESSESDRDNIKIGSSRGHNEESSTTYGHDMKGILETSSEGSTLFQNTQDSKKFDTSESEGSFRSDKFDYIDKFRGNSDHGHSEPILEHNSHFSELDFIQETSERNKDYYESPESNTNEALDKKNSNKGSGSVQNEYDEPISSVSSDKPSEDEGIYYHVQTGYLKKRETGLKELITGSTHVESISKREEHNPGVTDEEHLPSNEELVSVEPITDTKSDSIQFIHINDTSILLSSKTGEQIGNWTEKIEDGWTDLQMFWQHPTNKDYKGSVHLRFLSDEMTDESEIGNLFLEVLKIGGEDEKLSKEGFTDIRKDFTEPPFEKIKEIRINEESAQSKTTENL